MSVSNGQDANETTFNNAFVSKTSNDTKTGTLTMSDTTQSSDKDTGALILEGGLGVEKNINAGGTIAGSNLSNTNTGDVTFEAVGSTPAAEGASVSGQAITLQPADATHPGLVSTTTQSFAGDKTFTGNMTISGDLTVNGSTTTVNTETLDVTDVNITVNKGGDNTTAQGAGITVERTGTDGSIIYDSSVASRFKVGDLGTETEIMSIGTAQTVTGEKTFSAAIAIAEQGSTPSTPSSGFQKIYPKGDGKFYHLDDAGNETELGSGSGSGGSGGVNFFDNENFSVTTDGVSTYDDGGAYVDGTGGTPGTLGINIIDDTNPRYLDGDGSLEITKGNADESGTGFSFTTRQIGPYYRGQVLFGSFKFRITSSGTNYPSNDLKIHAYDVTNAAELSLEPYAGDDLYIPNVSQGEKRFKIYGTDSSTTTIRISLHLETDNTAPANWNITIDELKVGPESPIFGLAGTDIQSYTPTLNSTTNVSSNTGRYRLIGDQMELSGTIHWTGAGPASALTITPPSGYVVDTSKLSSTSANETIIGPAVWFDNGVSWRLAQVVYNTGTSAFNIVIEGGGSQFFTSQAGSGDFIAWQAKVPIAGAKSNVTLSNSSSFWISQLMATAGRVTGSAPTNLGEYRSYLRNAAASTFTETNGSPTASPSITNGIALYAGNAYASADTNNQPTRYDIYVGKNKHVTPYFFRSTGRTGNVDPDAGYISSTQSVGYNYGYDETTGIFWVGPNYNTGSETTHNSGKPENSTTVDDIYFDLLISEKAQAVGLVVPQSEVIVTTPSGHGSTNNKIRHFTVTESNTGTAITFSSDSTNGASFTINENGIYAMNYNYDFRTAAISGLGITRNSAALTTSVLSITDSTLLALTETTSNQGFSVSATRRLIKGDVIRPHTDGNLNSTAAATKFSIIKVSD